MLNEAVVCKNVEEEIIDQVVPEGPAVTSPSFEEMDEVDRFTPVALKIFAEEADNGKGSCKASGSS